MDIEKLVEKQRNYFYSGATLDPSKRVKALNDLHACVKAHEKDIAAALREDLNKSEVESYMTETGMVLEELRYLAAHTVKWSRAKRASTPLSQFSANSFVYPEPYGVALIMSPWNYPFQLCINPLAGALCAGNCAIVKPSAYASATSRLIAKLLGEVFPEEYVAVVEGGRAENAALLEQKFDYIFFTGSVSVGKLVMEKAAAHLTPVSLELGGKSPVIIDKSAKLPLAAKRVAFGKLTNAGQTCVAPDYLLMPRALRGEFIEEYKKAVASFYPNGDYSGMPTIINDKHFKRLTDLIEGEYIEMGGGSDPVRRFIEPTLLTDVSPEAPIMRQEIFGPILPVLDCDSIDEAISFVRERPKPLALYLFTESKEAESKVLSGLSFGGGCINDTIVHLAGSSMGFGGVGESGMGSYHGKKSFDTFTHYKSIMRKHTWMDMALRYPPYSDKTLDTVKRFMK